MDSNYKWMISASGSNTTGIDNAVIVDLVAFY